jgi:HK97 family phage portal protein
VLHFAGLGYDSINGYRLFDLARDAIGLSKASELFGMTFFGEGAHAGGFLETTKTLKPEAKKNLRESWNLVHQGPHRSHRVAVLEDGMKFNKNTVDPEQAQFLETRRFQILEIARVFRLPPHKLGDWSQSHLASVEEGNLDYLTTTLAPWLEMIEQEVNRKLLSPVERRVWFVKHNMASLLRGNSAARISYYKGLFEMGVLSTNDIASDENLNPTPGGDTHFIPSNNLTPLAQAAAGPAVTTPAKEAPADAAPQD